MKNDPEEIKKDIVEYTKEHNLHIHPKKDLDKHARQCAELKGAHATMKNR